jgi:hypothetical protein
MWRKLHDHEIIKAGDMFCRMGVMPFGGNKGIAPGHTYIGLEANAREFYDNWRVWRKIEQENVVAVDAWMDIGEDKPKPPMRRLPGNRFLASPLPLP